MENQNLTVEVFIPIIAELNALKLKAQSIDRTDLVAVKAVRLELKAKRVEVEKFCKGARENANNFAKMVIAKEKELVAIISPEEDELASIEAEIKRLAEREERKALLPNRIERLKAIYNGKYDSMNTVLIATGVTEDDLLDMDGSNFEGLVNRKLAEKNQADRDEIARQQAEIDRQRDEQEKEAKRLEDDKKAREREELARQEERERIAQEQTDKEAREKEEAEEKLKAKFTGRCKEVSVLGLEYTAEHNAYILEDFYIPVFDIQALEDGAWALLVEKIKAEMKRREDARIETEKQAKLEADLRYQAWLTKNNYTADRAYLYRIEDKGKVVELYEFKAKFIK